LALGGEFQPQGQFVMKPNPFLQQP
jgi:hypothetical protein